MLFAAHFDEGISMVWVDADVYWFIIYFCFLNIVSLSYCPWKKVYFWIWMESRKGQHRKCVA